MDNTLEIIREARKAGLQVALLMFMALLAVSILFGVFIYMSYQIPPTSEVSATMDNYNGNNTITQEVK